MQRRSTIVLPLFLLLLIVACGQNKKIEVSSNFDPLADFPLEATYVWELDEDSLPEDPRLRTPEMDARIRTAADAQFAKRGYRVAASGGADYQLSYQFRVHNWYSVDVSTSIGTISFELTESDSRRRVWTGYGRAELYVGLTEEESNQRLGDAMARMLKHFPPTQRPGNS